MHSFFASATRRLPAKAALILVASTLALSACNDDDITHVSYKSAGVSSVSVKPKGVILNIGGTQQMSADVMEPGSTTLLANPTIKWSSADPAIATVSESGLVTAVGSGTASIVGTTPDGGKGATAIVVLPPVSAITLTGASGPVSIGSARQLTATALDANGKPIAATLTWTSSAPTVVSVNNGVITGLSPGNATITATSGTKSATFNVSADFLTATLALSPNPLTVAAGSTGQLTATAKDGAGNTLTGRPIVWSVRAPTALHPYVGSISQTGLFTMPAGQFGSQLVTASTTDLGGTTTATALVNPLISGVALTGLNGPVNADYIFLVNVPAGTTAMTVTLSGGTGDPDLYCYRPTSTSPDFFSENGAGATERCTVASPFTAGVWVIEVFGFSAFAGWSLTASITPTPP